MTPREWALWYLERGYHPIPCAPRSKRPLVEWRGYQTNPPLLAEVERWWTERPDANIALVMGRGAFALDFDGGPAAEELVAARNITLPTGAPKSRTGSGGAHVLLSGHCSDRVGLFSTDGHKPQVDVRGIGIIVVPPSIHPNGQPYQWEVPLVPVAELPKAPPVLIALISQAGNEPAASSQTTTTEVAGESWVTTALRGVGEGHRDDTCARLAGYFLHQGLPSDIVEAVLLSGFAPRCKPPYPSKDVHKTVLSITRKESVTNERTQAITPEHIGHLMARVVTELQSDARPTVCPTPFGALNQLLDGGFTPGELVYLGARPGVGKTALALDFARAASKAGNVLVISREMLNTSLGLRMLAQEGHISASSLKRREFTKHEYAQLSSTATALAERRLWLTDRVVRLSEIADLMGQPPDDAPWSLVVVDYLQLIRAPNDIKDRRLQVEAVSQGLKTLAVQYEVPVLCLSSLSRPPQGNPEPTLASLRESGELEHDADVVLLLHRPDELGDDVRCRVAKARNGRLGPVQLVFQRDYVTFTQPETESSERVWTA